MLFLHGGSETVLREAILHLGIERTFSRASIHPIGLLRHRRIAFFATLGGTPCPQADISCL
jgi:hypothetical protein